VLREAFNYPYQKIAEIIHASEVTTRQLVSRARKRLAAERETSVALAERTRFFSAFLAAAQTGQLTVFEQMLTADVVNYTDGVRTTRAPRTGEVQPGRTYRLTTAANCERQPTQVHEGAESPRSANYHDETHGGPVKKSRHHNSSRQYRPDRPSRESIRDSRRSKVLEVSQLHAMHGLSTTTRER